MKKAGFTLFEILVSALILALLVTALANIFVAGSYIIKTDDPKAAADKLRSSVEP